MKRLFLLVCIVIAQVSFAQEESQELVAVNWLTNLDTAKKISVEENKPILMYFTGSDWCPPCIALKKDFFGSEDFQKYESQFVMVEIDRPRRMDIISEDQMEYNKEIIAKYNKGKSFPLLLLLDKKGSIKDKISGYSSYNSYKDVSYHYKFVEKALASF